MVKTLRLRIVTPERTIVDEHVKSVRFHGVDGDYGILANHAYTVQNMFAIGALLFFEVRQRPPHPLSHCPAM